MTRARHGAHNDGRQDGDENKTTNGGAQQEGAEAAPALAIALIEEALAFFGRRHGAAVCTRVPIRFIGLSVLRAAHHSVGAGVAA